MPLYDFLCKTCGHVDEEYRKMDHPTLDTCPKCGVMTYLQQVSISAPRNAEFHTAIELQSAGCNSWEEIREMQRAGIEISDDPKSELFGIPIARNRQQKLKAYKVAGMVETK